MRFKKMMTAVGTIGAIALVGTACGDQRTAGPDEQQPPAAEQPAPNDQASAPPENPSPPQPNAPGQPVAPPVEGAEGVPSPQVNGMALPGGYPQQVWVNDAGRTLVITAQEGGCGQASAELTDQTDQQVAVRLVETIPADAQACTMDIRYPTMTVELAEPLGERIVVLTYEERDRSKD
ncbi:hypothetical protein SAMN05421810_104491 [Amycolatopsis arida]|uniref:Uncharacterized protein n=1 Tax=Amycolatopsis arida TaxID=587909 RepID=A0A1I5VS76_9PSEU|nr:hypothetical protein [Amycolatopsis arida]TDX88004.1 hypothetical protein CLV69_112137 [Amycolatopsis arida]SFQ10310.1 hypothetical protein SAMN05421810_104491 [Amycolatopsis arida]